MLPALRGVLLVVGVIGLLAAVATAGDLYRWRDADGVVHFSDSPPEAPYDAIRSDAVAPPPAEPTAEDNGEAAATSNGGVFWRIDAAERPPSYLLGTIHSSDPRVTALKPPIVRAFDEAAVFVMEIDLNVDNFLSLGASMMFTDGRDLETLLGPDDFRKVAAAVAKHGIPETILRRMKPWAVLALMSQPVPQSGAFMDMMLYQKATAAGKPVFGLESVDEQIAVFNQMAMADQLALLRSSLAQADQLPTMQERMIATYLAGDLDAIAALTDELANQGPRGVNRRFLYQLNDLRNDRMVVRMTPHIDTGGAFIAVGALHLTGERGLIRQLSARGYRLSPLN